MNILVTGGCGFLGRWVVKKLLENTHDIFVLDNLENGKLENLEEFKNNPNLKIVIGDILDEKLISKLFNDFKFDLCIHLAAQINVQESLDNPDKSIKTNVLGTYYLLELSRKFNTKFVLVSTCMVYNLANIYSAIKETHEVKPKSPYASTKLAAEYLTESYYHAFALPVVILRPFNIYGPFQKTNMEGGVVSIFLKKHLDNEELQIFGTGTQTRDLMYVEDCADFIIKAAFSEKAVGQIINAGFGKDISIKDLASLIEPNSSKIKHIPHHHPQAEIPKLICDYSKAKQLLDWTPKTALEEGINKTKEWISLFEPSWKEASGRNEKALGKTEIKQNEHD